MHILFVHQNYPAQFGHIARQLVALGHRCTFLTERDVPAGADGVEIRRYFVRGGATRQTHYCSRTFENAIWRCQSVYDSLREIPQLKPDLIIAHSGFGSSLFLSELWQTPVINYFEYFYHANQSDLDFRPDFPVTAAQRLRARARNAMILLDLENCVAGYSPTPWQRGRLPVRYHDKVRVLFDGIDTTLWRPVPRPTPQSLGLPGTGRTQYVTYVSRGFESMRGFDIFMQAARLVTQQRHDVQFLVVGEDRVCYGGDNQTIGQQSFLEWVLSQAEYDRSRFVFLGRVLPSRLVELYALSSVHVYLTVPFVLSWSLWNALACGVPVIASDTPPVRDLIVDGVTGWLSDFFDHEQLARRIIDSLDQAPELRQTMGRAGQALVESDYSLDVCLPQHLSFYQEIADMR